MLNSTTLSPVVGIWDNDPIRAELFEVYDISLTFVDMVLGTLPQSPKMIENWLQTKAGAADDRELLRRGFARTLKERGVEGADDLTLEELEAAAAELAVEYGGNVFRRDPVQGLYIDGGNLKSMLEESFNILYPGDKWGKKTETRAKRKRNGDVEESEVQLYAGKGTRSFIEERVVVEDSRVYLGRMEPDGVFVRTGTVAGAQGPRSIMTSFEYCVQPTVSFTLRVDRESVPFPKLKAALIKAEDIGTGGCRNAGKGKFKVVRCDRRWQNDET